MSDYDILWSDKPIFNRLINDYNDKNIIYYYAIITLYMILLLRS